MDSSGKRGWIRLGSGEHDVLHLSFSGYDLCFLGRFSEDEQFFQEDYLGSTCDGRCLLLGKKDRAFDFGHKEEHGPDFRSFRLSRNCSE